MIRTEIRLDHRGALRGFSVSGHAGAGAKGEDLVCAAVSFLFRTAARVLQLQSDLQIRGGAPEAGRMELEIEELPDARHQWLAGLSELLIRGVRDLAEENPGTVVVQIIEGKE